MTRPYRKSKNYKPKKVRSSKKRVGFPPDREIIAHPAVNEFLRHR